MRQHYGTYREAVPERLAVVPTVVDDADLARLPGCQRLAHRAHGLFVGALPLREARVLPHRLRHRVATHVLPGICHVDDRPRRLHRICQHHAVVVRVQHADDPAHHCALRRGEALEGWKLLVLHPAAARRLERRRRRRFLLLRTCLEHLRRRPLSLRAPSSKFAQLSAQIARADVHGVCGTPAGRRAAAGRVFHAVPAGQLARPSSVMRSERRPR